MEEAGKKTDEEILKMWDDLTYKETMRALRKDKQWFWLYAKRKIRWWNKRGHDQGTVEKKLERLSGRCQIIYSIWGFFWWMVLNHPIWTTWIIVLIWCFIDNIFSREYGIFEMFMSCFIGFIGSLIASSFLNMITGSKRSAASDFNRFLDKLEIKKAFLFRDYRYDVWGKPKEPKLK